MSWDPFFLLLKTLPTHNKHIFVRQKGWAYYGNSAYLGKRCLFWEGEDFEKKGHFPKITKFPKIRTPFLAARKCAYYEWAQNMFLFFEISRFFNESN